LPRDALRCLDHLPCECFVLALAPRVDLAGEHRDRRLATASCGCRPCRQRQVSVSEKSGRSAAKGRSSISSKSMIWLAARGSSASF